MFQTRTYIRELLDYLNTVTIKNEFIADQMLDTWVHDEFKDKLPKHLHPYYRNITGDYILKDLSELEPLLGIDRSEMTVEEYRELKPWIEEEAYKRYGLSTYSIVEGRPYPNSYIYTKFNDLVIINSLDNQETIPLTKTIINTYDHIRTIAHYKIPNLSYYTLCERYPTSSAIIKALLFPIKDRYGGATIYTSSMDYCINAPNLTILSSEDDCLEPQERHSILECMFKTMEYIKTRWSVREFGYEELYPCAHEAIIWNMLFLSLIVQRIKNIKTYSAHSYHIWEYIKSHGLGDYRTILNEKQTLFLYRNLPYLIKHKGTEKALELLSYVILYPGNIQILNKILAQQTYDPTGELDPYNVTESLIPAVISKRVGQSMFAKLEELVRSRPDMAYQDLLVELEKVAGKDYGSLTDMDLGVTTYPLKTLLDKERSSGLEYQDDSLFERSYNSQNKALSITPHNLLKSKLLEIKNPASIIVFETLYARYATQQILYRSSTDSLKFAINLITGVSDAFVTLTANEAIALLMYAISKEKGYNQDHPPSAAYITRAHKATNHIVERFHTGDISRSSKPILKLIQHAYAFEVRGDDRVKGLYIPQSASSWTNTETNHTRPNYKATLSYVSQNNRWEFNVGNRLIAYSTRIKYKDKQALISSSLWESPIYWFKADGTRYIIQLSRILDPAKDEHYVLSKELYAPKIYTSVESFSENIHKLAKGYVSRFAEAGFSASNLYSDFLYAQDQDMGVREVVPLDLLNGKSYKEFFLMDDILEGVINNLDISEDPKEAYAQFAVDILKTLYPINDPINLEPPKALRTRYQLLKELFVSMCSYNVAFLDAAREDITPYTLPRMGATVHKSEVNIKYTVNLDMYKVGLPIHHRIKWNDLNAMVVN